MRDQRRFRRNRPGTWGRHKHTWNDKTCKAKRHWSQLFGSTRVYPSRVLVKQTVRLQALTDDGPYIEERKRWYN